MKKLSYEQRAKLIDIIMDNIETNSGKLGSMLRMGRGALGRALLSFSDRDLVDIHRTIKGPSFLASQGNKR